MIRKIFSTLLLLSIAFFLAPIQAKQANETLTYKVLYKWGLIHKQAGTATFYLTSNSKYYNAKVIARSASWADKFYHLRDTLTSRMSLSDYAPVRYERLAHEDGKYSRDLVEISRSGNNFSAKCTRWRRKKDDKNVNVASTTLSASGMTVDLVSSFYYLRALPFGTMNPGTAVRLNIFSGKRKELLTITYTGLTSVKIDSKTYQAYKVKFTFTSDGKKQTSSPIEAWISTDAKHIPLKLVGSLKIGQVQCIYAGKL